MVLFFGLDCQTDQTEFYTKYTVVSTLKMFGQQRTHLIFQKKREVFNFLNSRFNGPNGQFGKERFWRSHEKSSIHEKNQHRCL